MSSPSPPKRPPFLNRWVLFALMIILAWGIRTFLFGVPAQVRAGEAALKAKDPAKATRQFDAAIKADPTNPELYYQIFQACSNQKNWEMAIVYGKQAVVACKDAPPPVRAQLYMLLSQAYTEVEIAPHQDRAIDAAQRAFELNPDDPEIMNGYGYRLADNDRKLDEAVPLLKRALELLKQQSNSPETRRMVAVTEDSYGWALYKQGNYPEAVGVILQALSDVTNSLPEEAKTEEAKRAEEEDLKVLNYHLGAAYRKAGRLQEARKALESALRYDPNYAPAKAELELLPPPAAPTSDNRSEPGPAKGSETKGSNAKGSEANGSDAKGSDAKGPDVK